MTESSLAAQRLALERERFEFEKTQAQNASPYKKHLGAIITTSVALIAALFSGTQIFTTYLSKSREIALATLQNEAEMDRLWRIERLRFLEAHESSLFSKDAEAAERAMFLLELSFPPQYVQPVRSKLQILKSTTATTDKRKVFDELLKPLVQQLDRTAEAFKRYSPRNFAVEAELRYGNRRARDLLVEKRDLIPDHLREDAARLAEHYEVWLQEYVRIRVGEKPDLETPFVFAGAKGYPFPAESEERFRAEFEKYRRELGQGSQ